MKIRMPQPLALFLLLGALSQFAFYHADGADAQQAKVYIAYMGANNHPSIEATHSAHHHVLSHVFESNQKILDSVLYHYKHGFSGFSALLTPTQAEVLGKLPEVISIGPSRYLKTKTTRTWTSLGLNPNSGIWPNTSFGEDVIIGLIDSGIWPESESFNDEGLSCIPKRWKGKCIKGEQFDPRKHCNKKIIGARWFSKAFESNPEFPRGNIGLRSARDTLGHGTFCASTAAGARVANASFFGLARGTASGGAPAARIAVYKAIWEGIGAEADLLAAIDQAVHDGVDIISFSIGGGGQPDYYNDMIAIGAYHAALKGILFSASAGNDGPAFGTLNNGAPWILTVAASTMDREFVAEIELGDGTIIQGGGVKQFDFEEKSLPIVDATEIPADGANFTDYCVPGSLDSKKAAGKIVICYDANVYPSPNGSLVPFSADQTVKDANGSGLILIDSGFSSTARYPYSFRWEQYVSPIPTAGVAERTALDYYLSNCRSSNTTPTATIRRTKTILKESDGPVVAEFSSRGPYYVSFALLKPDIAAPGVDILGAWTEFEGVLTPEGTRTTKYTVISGTSMACPHASGAAAIVKAKHRDWSPAAIKSAIMTTATPLSAGNVFDWGSGYINVLGAVDPGLVYDLEGEDYAIFLCNLNYTDDQFRAITSQNRWRSCPEKLTGPQELNYPSIGLSTLAKATPSVIRTVTNVGPAISNYEVTVNSPDGVFITVTPSTLNFTRVNERLSFNVSMEVLFPDTESFGSITWTDEFAVHTVTSPIFVGPFDPIIPILF